MLPPLRFVSVLFLLKSVNSKSVCTEEEHKESARAFINCVESAKARIILTQQNATDEQLVCESLENMLDGCEKQVSKIHLNFFYLKHVMLTLLRNKRFMLDETP